jgi:hypothetical protein
MSSSSDVFFEAMLVPVYFLIGGILARRALLSSGGEVPALQPFWWTFDACIDHRTFMSFPVIKVAARFDIDERSQR